jgi:hypothetical protein
MPQQLFSSDTYAIRPTDVLPDDEVDDTDHELDTRWVHYCEVARGLDTEDLMAVIGEAFSTSDVLRGLIEEIKEQPYLPDERKSLHVMTAIRLGEEVARLISSAMDDAVGLRMAVVEDD